jgi:mannose-6-phosphate isomerase-like protein (cupin superfamily)
VARVIDRDEEQALRLLDAVGVRIHHVVGDTGDASPAVVAQVLPPAVRHIRAEADVAVPDDVDAGMGAWHVNAVDELHVVSSGEGVMEFITLDGVVSVVVTEGDVIEIRGAEHRYRPLSPQHWRLRFAGSPADDLASTATGRAQQAWPATG